MWRRSIQGIAVVLAVVAVWIGVSYHNHHSSNSDAWVASTVGTVHQTTNGTTANEPTTTNESTTTNEPNSSNSGASATQLTKSATTLSSTGTATSAASTQGKSSTPDNSSTASTSKPATTGTSSKSTSSPSTPASPPASGTPPTLKQPDLGTFTIEVTRDRGKTTISDIRVPIVAGQSVMDYMRKYFQIETAYGDGFMVSINGLKSQWTGVPASQRQPVDWFLYVNEQSALVGANAVTPRAGDVDVWDYHSWDPNTGRG